MKAAALRIAADPDLSCAGGSPEDGNRSGKYRPDPERRITVESRDLRKKLRSRRGNLFIVFAVDASDSMESASRIASAKGAVISILKTAYISRDRAALIVFRDQKARLVLPPTSSVSLAGNRLRKIRTGGATPLSDALRLTLRLVVQARLKNPLETPVLFLLSDGEANVPLVSGSDIGSELSVLARELRGKRLMTFIVDTGSSAKGSILLKKLSEDIGGRYKKITGPGALREALRDGVIELETGLTHG